MSYTLPRNADSPRAIARAQAIRELEEFLASIPPVAEFRSTRVALYEGLVLLLAACAFIYGSLLSPNGVVIAVSILITVISVGQVIANLGAGRRPLMTLTHTHLHHPLLPQPLPLTAVSNARSEVAPFRIWRNAFHTVQLDVASFLSRPPIRRSALRFLFGASHTGLFKRPDRLMLEVAAPRFSVNGQTLDVDELEDTVHLYLQAADAHERLTALRASS